MAKKASVVLTLKDNFTNPLKKAQTGTKKFGSETKLAKYNVQKFSSEMKENFVKVAKRAAVAIGTVKVAQFAKNMVDATTKQADTVDKMSQKIGISRKAYQELDFVTSQCGASITSMKAGMKTLTNNMQSAADGSDAAQEMFDKLGLSIYDSNGNLKSQEKMMWESFSALQGMSNQTEKAALAVDLFGGRVGSDLMPMLNGAAGSIEEMRKKANDLGLIMEDSTVDSGVALTDTLDQLDRSANGVKYTIAGALLPHIQKFGDWVVKHMPQIKSYAEIGANKITQGFKLVGKGAKWAKDNMNWLKPVAIGLFSAFAAYKTINKAYNAFTQIRSAIKICKTAFGGLNLATMGWIGIIVAVIAIIVLVVKNWKTVVAWLKKLKDRFMNAGGAIGVFRDGIFTVVAAFKAVIGTVKKVIGKVKEFLGLNTDKTINVKTVEEGLDAGAKAMQGAPVPKHATGTTYFKGGLTGFSESGRAEEAIFPSGTRIIPADKAGKGTQGKIVNVYLTVQGNVIGNEKYMEETGNYIARKIIAAEGNI
ncbi:phage tail tape measure protein [Senimuribacter intestinalis]|uniref:phage tail tape measure protein n=1 Tax=Senimuribacter intestinalis TaxID=2941507 RepID=UPI00203D223B|nr:phage tail tape measure protein [Senimuribacter intestinalis]